MFRHESWTYVIIASIVIALVAVAVDLLRGHADASTLIVALGWGVSFFVLHALLNSRSAPR